MTPLRPPASDDEVPAFVAGLGLPGLIDLHVHFLPHRVLRKVWAYFDAAGDRFGLPWPIHYRTTDDERVAVLRKLGVTRFTALSYPHRPGMADWLNGWALDFAARTPFCLPSATFYPEPGAGAYVRSALERGARVFKTHLQVGAFDPRDPRLRPVWGQLADAGVPVICHCGNGPEPGPFTGPGPINDVLAAHPGLRLVIAHLGMPDYSDFLDLAERFPDVHLDTTMVFTPFMDRLVAPVPPSLLPRLTALGDRIVHGSDFPNIPYPYAAQLAALCELGLGEEWLRAVLYDNARRLLDEDRPLTDSATP